MKKRITLIKSLLVAATLLVGGASSVWAGDYYNVTRYSQDYEDATTYDAGWVFGGGDHSQDTANGSKYLKMSLNKNKATVTNTLSFASNSYFTDATDYQFSFDFGYGSGNAYQKPTSLTLKGKDGVTLFMFKNSADQAWGNDFVLTDGADNNLGTYTATYKVLSNPLLNITVTGNSDDGVKLTVNNNGTKIADDVKIANFTTIESIEIVVTGGASVYGFDNMILKEHSDVAVAEDPTFAFKSVSGDDRVYTISNPNTGGTLYYTTVSADDAPAIGDASYTSTTESSVEVTYGAGKYYAYAILSDGTTTSGIASQEVVGGAITLKTPIWTKTAYNAETGCSTVELSSDQSSLLGTPVADIYYIIDDASAVKYTSAITVTDGQVLKYYATASGYTDSEQGSVTAVAPFLGSTIFSENYTSGTDKLAITLGDQLDETAYYYMIVNEAKLSERVLTDGSEPNNFLQRTNPAGIYSGTKRSYAIPGLSAGQYVIIKTANGQETANPTANTNLTFDAWNSLAGTFCFNVTDDGMAIININRYCSIVSITVKSTKALATIGTEGWATIYTDAALNFKGVEGLTAYTATCDGSKVTLTPVDDVQAGTAVVLKGEAKSYDVPVIASSETAKGDLKASATAITYSDEATSDYYYLALNAESKAQFTKLTSGSIAAGKAYLEIAKGEGARNLAIVIAGETTGIKAIETAKAANGIFNINGQRIAAPQKGLYIVNGKKVVIK